MPAAGGGPRAALAPEKLERPQEVLGEIVDHYKQYFVPLASSDQLSARDGKLGAEETKDVVGVSDGW